MIVGGILSPIENVLTEVLIWLHETGGLTWAWSIVALTVIVRMLLVPVAIRQIHSMQSLQIHAPEMKAIQQRYKADRQKQSEELMKFYKENKINPYASCLPIVFQIPIFIALFFVLRDFEDEVYPEVRRRRRSSGSTSSTSPSRRRTGSGRCSSSSTSISQLTSTWLMSTSMQSAAQRWMIMVLPIVFIPFILSFPSGLMIYWLTTNLWTTGQGLITRRQMPRPVAPPKRSSRTPPKEERGCGSGRARGRRRRRGCRRSHRPAAHESSGRRAAGESGERATPRCASRRAARRSGEAKWSALRELEQLVPGLDREQVEFEVVSEGERGPSRASATRPPASSRRPRAVASTERGHHRRTRAKRESSSSASREAIGADVTVSADRARRSRHRHLLRRGSRPLHRQARADDRCDPVPGERGRACGGRRARRRRRRRRVPGTPQRVARGGREPLGTPGRDDAEARSSSSP